MSVDPRHLHSFVAVAEEGNIGRAARRLLITQPALTSDAAARARDWMHRDDPLAGRPELELSDLDGRQVPLVGARTGAASCTPA